MMAETVRQAAIVLQNEFKSNAESRNALIASIHSAIVELQGKTTTLDLAEKIANRIIGLEDSHGKEEL